MPRQPKQSKQEKQQNTLLSALQFVALVQPKRSTILTHTHCRLFGNRLSAAGPVLVASVGIPEDIECCPNTQKFLDALKQCPETVNLTLLPTKELSVKSGNFQAAIPCIEQSELPVMCADDKQYPVELKFQQALEQVGEIVDEYSKLILYSSVVLLNGSVVGTSGEVIMESWHGCPTPVGLIVPKVFILAIRRAKGKAVYFIGNSDSTFTAHFPDGSWIKTQLHHDPELPDLQGFLSLPCSPVPVPLGLWAAVERLKPLSLDGRIYFREEGICTNEYQTNGAINLCDGLPHNISFLIESLQSISKFAEKLAFNVTAKMTYFQGNNIRGAIAQQ